MNTGDSRGRLTPGRMLLLVSPLASLLCLSERAQLPGSDMA